MSEKSKKHVNIPIFIPHLGCPNDCVFCNQRIISGKTEFKEENVISEIKNALATVDGDTETEIAYFGGSFTGIDRGLMIRLLDISQSFVDSGKVSSVRLSTRPDYISDEILTLLSRYSVKTIELGIQSTDSEVLTASKRGHTASDTEKACFLVREYGFGLVGQMMTGLPRSTPEKEIKTAEDICKMGASGARIYPTMTFAGTELEAMLKSGEYIPPTLEDSVKRTADVLRVFVENNVPVIRIGLHSGETLYSENGITYGSYHPAMGELVLGELYYGLVRDKMKRLGAVGKRVTVTVARGELSKAIGQSKKNKERLTAEFKPTRLTFAESDKVKLFDCSVYTE